MSFLQPIHSQGIPKPLSRNEYKYFINNSYQFSAVIISHQLMLMRQLLFDRDKTV